MRCSFETTVLCFHGFYLFNAFDVVEWNDCRKGSIGGRPVFAEPLDFVEREADAGEDIHVSCEQLTVSLEPGLEQGCYAGEVVAPP